MGTHRKSSNITMKKTFAVGAIAGAAAGFGALSLAPTAFADNNDNEGWWLGSGNMNGNNTIIGQSGNGIVNQNGGGNGNIMNNQLNALSPVVGSGLAVNAAPTTAVGGAAAVTNAPIAALNGNPVSTTLGVNPALAGNLGAALGGSNVTGANAALPVPINTVGANAATQAPAVIPTVPGFLEVITNEATGVDQGDVSADIEDNDDAGDAGNLQVASADTGDVSGGRNQGGDTRNGNGNTLSGGTGGSASASSNTTATAGGNVAQNSSNNNTVNNNGNDSRNSVGNDNDDD